MLYKNLGLKRGTMKKSTLFIVITLFVGFVYPRFHINDGQGSSRVGGPSATLTNNFFQITDWQNLLLPVFQKYATSGLTGWFYKGDMALPDDGLDGLVTYVSSQAAAVSGGRLDDIPNYVYPNASTGQNKSSIGSYPPFSPKIFLKNQGSNILSQGTGWYASYDTGKIGAFIQSGFGNTVAQYASALAENFIARAAIGASVFQTPSAQINNGFMGYVNQPMYPYGMAQKTGPGISSTGALITGCDEPQIIDTFVKQAQNLFCQARYSRLMYAFPQNLSSQLNSTGTTFSLPTNSQDLAAVNAGAIMGQSILNPLNTFCGVVVINETDPGNYIVQSNGSSNWGVLTNDDPRSVYFLPATNATPNATSPAPYDSYAPVDGMMGNGLPNRTVTFTTEVVNVNTVVPSTNSLSVTVSQNPLNQGDPVGLYWSANGTDPNGGSISLQMALNFGVTPQGAQDFKNFFAYPQQWAVVLKATTGLPQILGLIKLNPYDFPLNFMTAQMNSVLGLTSSGAPAQSGVAGTFSQRAVWDSAATLYSQAFPPGFLTNKSVKDGFSTGLSQYSFAYLALQGLLNGYLMSNTYSLFFDMTTWPQLSSVSSDYYGPGSKKWHTAPVLAGQNLFSDQVFPTPVTSDWLGKNSPLDWFYLRSLLATRSILQNMYCSYDLLMLPASARLKPDQSGFVDASAVTVDTLIEYMFLNPTETVTISAPPYNQDDPTRTIYGQSYVSGSSTPSNSYQWILPLPNSPAAQTVVSGASQDSSTSGMSNSTDSSMSTQSDSGSANTNSTDDTSGDGF